MYATLRLDFSLRCPRSPLLNDPWLRGLSRTCAAPNPSPKHGLRGSPSAQSVSQSPPALTCVELGRAGTVATGGPCDQSSGCSVAALRLTRSTTTTQSFAATLKKSWRATSARSRLIGRCVDVIGPTLAGCLPCNSCHANVGFSLKPAVLAIHVNNNWISVSREDSVQGLGVFVSWPRGSGFEPHCPQFTCEPPSARCPKLYLNDAS
ncbi:unnamed protein product [Lota lota]